MQFGVNIKINHLSINQNVAYIKFVPFQCANLNAREGRKIYCDALMLSMLITSNMNNVIFNAVDLMLKVSHVWN
jgi:hypothetical protein